MKFNHLPVAGGLYDQDPRLLEDWGYIFERRAERQAEEARQEREKSKRKSYSRGR